MITKSFRILTLLATFVIKNFSPNYSKIHNLLTLKQAQCLSFTSYSKQSEHERTNPTHCNHLQLGMQLKPTIRSESENHNTGRCEEGKKQRNRE